MKLTGGLGVDTAIEAVGLPATFEFCERIVAAGGTVADVGVHGMTVELHLESLRDRNITIPTRQVDTVSAPMLLRSVGSRRLDAKVLITHRFTTDTITEAYDTFARAPETHAPHGHHRRLSRAKRPSHATPRRSPAPVRPPCRTRRPRRP